MLIRASIPAPAGVLIAAGLLVAGCTSYAPKPLDLGSHEDEWRARTPEDESVRSFAQSLASGSPSDGEPFDPSDGLSLSEGELVALVYNPDLRLARLRAGVATASAEHAGLWDDPEFAIDVLRVTESVSNPWVITPGLAITIPISGRLAVEKQRADAAARAELDRVAEAEWRTRYEVRIAWSDWSAAMLRLREQELLIASIGSLVGSTTRLADAGEMIRTEATLFAIEQSQREYELRRLRGVAGESEQRLRSLLGLSPSAPVTFIAELDVSQSIDVNERDGWEFRHPTLVRLRQQYEVAEQTLRREIRKQYPDLTIGPLYETDQGQSRVGFLGAIPIPVLNANKQGIAEAEVERELARAEFETEYERMVGAIAAAEARAASLGAERDQIVTQMAPLVDRQLRDARRLLELGEGGGLVLLESLVRANDTKLHLIDVRLDEARSLAELAYLAGPVTGPGSAPDDPTLTATDEVTP